MVNNKSTCICWSRLCICVKVSWVCAKCVNIFINMHDISKTWFYAYACARAFESFENMCMQADYASVCVCVYVLAIRLRMRHLCLQETIWGVLSARSQCSPLWHHTSGWRAWKTRTHATSHTWANPQRPKLAACHMWALQICKSMFLDWKTNICFNGEWVKHAPWSCVFAATLNIQDHKPETCGANLQWPNKTNLSQLELANATFQKSRGKSRAGGPVGVQSMRHGVLDRVLLTPTAWSEKCSGTGICNGTCSENETTEARTAEWMLSFNHMTEMHSTFKSSTHVCYCTFEMFHLGANAFNPGCTECHCVIRQCSGHQKHFNVEI